MLYEVCKDMTGIFLIEPHLGAAIWMSKAYYVIDTFFSELSITSSFKRFDKTIYTANSWDDPDIISDAGPSIFTKIAVEIKRLFLWEISHLLCISIFIYITESCFDVVSMNMASGDYICGGSANRIGIFYYFTAGF